MRKLFLTYLIFNYLFVLGQIDGDALYGLPIVENSSTYSTTNPPKNGSLVFNSDTQKVLKYEDAEFIEIIDELTSVKTINTNYTIQEQDNHNVIRVDSTTDVLITVPNGLEDDFNVSIYQINEGKFKVEGETGVEIKNRLNRFYSAGKDAGVGIKAIDSNLFCLSGDVKQINYLELGTPVTNGELVVNYFADGQNSAYSPFQLGIRYTVTSPSTINYQILIDKVPYGSIPNLNDSNHTLEIIENLDGTYSYLFTGNTPLTNTSNYIQIIATGNTAPSPAGSGDQTKISFYEL